MSMQFTQRCSRCAKEVPADHIRIQLDGKHICKACLNAPQPPARPTLQRDAERKFTYQCPACHYQFRRAQDHTPSVCPQCGGKKLIRFEAQRMTGTDVLRIADDPRLENLSNGRRGL